MSFGGKGKIGGTVKVGGSVMAAGVKPSDSEMQPLRFNIGCNHG
jgi:hypothetical protein